MHNYITHDFCLKLQSSEDNEEIINSYYCSLCYDVKIKINNTKEIDLKQNEFYKLKTNEIVTHVKYPQSKRYIKA